MKAPVVALCLLAGASAVSAQEFAVVPTISPQQVRVDAGVVLAGTPDMDKLMRLTAGTTVVVDLRTATEGIAEQAHRLGTEGFEYHHIPVAGAKIDSDQVAALRDIAQRSTGKTLIVHCRSANRAGMLWGGYLLEQGRSLDHSLAVVGPAMQHQRYARAVRAYAAAAGNAAATVAVPAKQAADQVPAHRR